MIIVIEGNIAITDQWSLLSKMIISRILFPPLTNCIILEQWAAPQQSIFPRESTERYNYHWLYPNTCNLWSRPWQFDREDLNAMVETQMMRMISNRLKATSLPYERTRLHWCFMWRACSPFFGFGNNRFSLPYNLCFALGLATIHWNFVKQIYFTLRLQKWCVLNLHLFCFMVDRH